MIQVEWKHRSNSLLGNMSYSFQVPANPSQKNNSFHSNDLRIRNLMTSYVFLMTSTFTALQHHSAVRGHGAGWTREQATAHSGGDMVRAAGGWEVVRFLMVPPCHSAKSLLSWQDEGLAEANRRRYMLVISLAQGLTTASTQGKS